jgi:hypothetical protein
MLYIIRPQYTRAETDAPSLVSKASPKWVTRYPLPSCGGGYRQWISPTHHGLFLTRSFRHHPGARMAVGARGANPGPACMESAGACAPAPKGRICQHAIRPRKPASGASHCGGARGAWPRASEPLRRLSTSGVGSSRPLYSEAFRMPCGTRTPTTPRKLSQLDAT